ncbi:BatD family protein [Halarcobacter anaerophilus]|uniref:BatD protein n=1 Tax=Halarcobacter anaerophilus TaxID=877500 RepID=A0A4Q0XYN9_9BACT|nr:BatD family protein [Halarcobacter anaerophilus]QDF29837.1 putative aerotolerance protein BatD [Halarcobacter anaerophilus]RXJ62800.1 hypothetical protein CRV06_08170 [Halarcobacter anaerophilus]
MKLFKSIFLFFLFQICLYAEVVLNAPQSFVKGEPYFFEFEVEGSSITFPKIKDIDGFVVENQGTSKSVQIINGDYSQKLKKRYKIVPTTAFTIPSFKFEIDGKEFFSQAKKVVLKKVTKTDSSNFDLTLIPSKTDLYVGEDLLLKLVFKYKKDLQITNLGFEKPHFENFWYKQINSNNQRYEQNGYIVQELDFLLFAQKSGELNINPLRVDAQLMQSDASNPFSFFSTVPKVEKIYSNELKFNVKPLPKGVNLIGDFDIKASVDKTKIKQSQSISLKLNITGTGNFDDIEDFKLNIPNATIYDNKPDIKTKYTNKGYEGVYSKVFSIVPENSIEIPRITLKYFSKKEQKVVEKRTQSFTIEVEKSKKEQKVILQKAEKAIVKVEKNEGQKEEISYENKLKYFLFGIITTLLILGLYKFVRVQNSKKVSQDTPLGKLVKKTENRTELMKVLVPYLKKDSVLDELIFECESDKDFKILKKEILKRLKEIKI